MILLLLVSLLAVLQCLKANFIMTTTGFVAHERLDPIIAPGKISSHVHSIIGASNFGPEINSSYLRESECTTVPVVDDMSSYWIPHLFFEFENGTYAPVQPEVPRIYYFVPTTDQAPDAELRAFPDGFRMLLGDPFRRKPYDDDDPLSRALIWRCIGSSAEDDPFDHLPGMECPGGLRGEIRFPTCWDGETKDPDDHISHVKYGEAGTTSARIDSFDCPSSHPVIIPRLLIEVYWQTDQWSDRRSDARNSSQPFVLSMGDPTGYGAHGDFVNGWNVDVLQDALDDESCRNAAVASDCDIFETQPEDSVCFKSTEVNEVALGYFDSLPGCNPTAATKDDIGKGCEDQESPGFLLPPTVFTSRPFDDACQPNEEQDGCRVVEAEGHSGEVDSGSSSDEGSESTSDDSSTESNDSAAANRIGDGNGSTGNDNTDSTTDDSTSSDSEGDATKADALHVCQKKTASSLRSRLSRRWLMRPRRR